MNSKRNPFFFAAIQLLVCSLLLVAAGCGSASPSASPDPGPSAAAPADSTSGQSADDNAAGGDAADSGTDNAGDGTASGDEAAATDTRLFVDGLGREVRIPVSPERVIVSEFSAEALTAGVTPLAVGPNDLKNAFTSEQLAGIPDIGDPPNPELILSLEPDLLLFSQYMPDIYPQQMEQIEKIAPVVYIRFEDPIYDVLPTVADALGKPDAVRPWIDEYEAERRQAMEQVRQAIGDETVSIFRIEKGRLRIYLSTNFGGYAVRSALQANAPDAVKAEIGQAPWSNAVQISLEKLPEYAGDHLLLIVSDTDEDQQEYKDIQSSSLWQSLPAVRNGNVHLLGTPKYYNADNITVRETMKEIANMLSSGKP